MTLGDRIRNARLQKDMTQEEVALDIGTTKQTIFKYENGLVTNIPLDRLEALADVLDVSPAYLMGWEDDMNSHVGTRIAEARKEKGLTLAELGELLEVSASTIRKWETSYINGERTKNIPRLAEVLGVKPDYLYGLEEKETEYNPRKKYKSIARLEEYGDTITEEQDRMLEQMIEVIMSKKDENS